MERKTKKILAVAVGLIVVLVACGGSMCASCEQALEQAQRDCEQKTISNPDGNGTFIGGSCTEINLTTEDVSVVDNLLGGCIYVEGQCSQGGGPTKKWPGGGGSDNWSEIQTSGW